MLSLHRDSPLDQQAAAPAADSPAPAPAQSAGAASRDDGFAGFTLKGGKGGGAKKEAVVPQQGNIAGAAYLLHKVCAHKLMCLPLSFALALALALAFALKGGGGGLNCSALTGARLTLAQWLHISICGPLQSAEEPPCYLFNASVLLTGICCCRYRHL